MPHPSRRQFLGAIAATALPALTRPNIILMLADDLGWGDLRCYGQKRIQTPNLDAMAARGMRFTQAYAGSSVCAPSRCCLMTGRHNGHGRVRDNLPHEITLQPDDLTVAEVLKRAGYRTGATGKWSLGTPGTWGLPWMQGFDEFFGYLDQDHAHNYYPEYLWENDREVLQQANRANMRKSYSPDRMVEHAVRFIESNRQRPFFYYFATTLPHWSSFPRRSVESQDVPSDAPYSGQAWPQVEKNYAAMVTRLDGQAGRILDTVRRLGIERQTLILFTSDNGPSAEGLHRPDFFQSGGPFRGVKRDLYEGGIRIPLIAQWTDTIGAGLVNESVCGFQDFLPTAADLAGLPAPKGVDGVSLAPALRGGRQKRDGYLYWDYGHVRDQFQQAARVDNWKAVRTGAGRPLELYDLTVDPGEQHNIAAEHPDVVARMKDVLHTAYVPSPDYPVRQRATP